jgi:hypothetical protein
MKGSDHAIQIKPKFKSLPIFRKYHEEQRAGPATFDARVERTLTKIVEEK